MKYFFFLVATILISLISLSLVYSEKKEMNDGFKYWATPLIYKNYAGCLSGERLTQCARAAEYMSFIGNQEEANRLWCMDNPKTMTIPQDTSIQLEHWNLVNAEQFLKERLEQESVVMFNEAHHKPEGRIFTRHMLKHLKKAGFTHLGVEGLKEPGSQLQARGYPNASSGFYIQEPQYANLLREAIDLNFIIFDYDIDSGRGKERELNQANKIYAVLQENRKAKIVIHAGWGHIREDNKILGGLMAYQFKKISGINPLSINQSRYVHFGTSDVENPLYKKLKNDINQATFLVNKANGQSYSDEYTDLLLFHPPHSYHENVDNRYFSTILNIPASTNYSLIKLYKNEEEAQNGAVPVYVREIAPKATSVSLCVPWRGEYIVHISSDGKNSIKKLNF